MTDPSPVPAGLVWLVEHLAGYCTHEAVPCAACTNLSIWAVVAFHETGWAAQQKRVMDGTARRSKGGADGTLVPINE